MDLLVCTDSYSIRGQHCVSVEYLRTEAPQGRYGSDGELEGPH